MYIHISPIVQQPFNKVFHVIIRARNATCWPCIISEQFVFSKSLGNWLICIYFFVCVYMNFVINCFIKMAWPKRKNPNRFLSLEMISISQLCVFTRGWEFSRYLVSSNLIPRKIMAEHAQKKKTMSVRELKYNETILPRDTNNTKLFSM